MSYLMTFFLFFLVMVGLVVAVGQERSKFCVGEASNLPSCTDKCIIGPSIVLDGTCPDSLAEICRLSDGIRTHLNEYGRCIRDACEDSDRSGVFCRSCMIMGEETLTSQAFIKTFQSECASVGKTFISPKIQGEFDGAELLGETASGSSSSAAESSKVAATSRKTAMDTPVATSMEPSTNRPESSSTSVAPSTPTSDPEEPTEEPSSQTHPTLPSTEAQQPAPTKEGEKSTSADASLPNPGKPGPATHVSNQNDDTIVHVHSTVVTTTKPSASHTGAAAASPTFSTGAIAGTAAGGTIGLILVISFIYHLMRRRKRRASYASSADIWEPTRNISTKAELDSTNDNNSTFGRYNEVRRQPSQAELPSETIASPRPHTLFSHPAEMRGGDGRYYTHPARRPEQQRHASNIDSRYPTLPTVSLLHPVSPMSDTSSGHGWHSNAPTLNFNPGEGTKSPISELGFNPALRTVRSVELQGESAMNPVSELGTGEKEGCAPVELSCESVPRVLRVGSGGGG